jgi:4'-phosphopantetheinyl transferase EntD
MTGSTTYCSGYRAAAVALTRDFVALGVDAELNEALPDDDMLDLIASHEEREHLDSLSARTHGICWDRLLFSAKLSAYKAWFPLESWWLNLELANIVINAYEGTFTAYLSAPGPVVGGAPVAEMCGRWLAHQGILVTTAVVPAS